MSKNKSISFRLTEEEYTKIKTYAKENGYDVSNYLVHKGLENIPCQNTDLSIIPEIRMLLSKLEHKVLKKKKFIEEMRKILNGK